MALYAGRLDESKGLFELVDAWRSIAARRPAARLWLAGEGPAEGALRRQILSLGLSASVVLPGTFDCLDDFWAAADLFVAPAHEAGTSLGLLEAMAAGLPVVGWRAGNLPYLASDQIEGLILEPGDIAGLAQAIERLALDEPLRRRMGEAGRRRAQARPTWDESAGLFFGAIRRALG